MNTTPRVAMLLAAGLGMRMRPLTDNTAKPMLQLDGRPLLDHALDRLESAGIDTIVVNAHWQAEQVAAHLKSQQRRARVILRHEPDLLDTGGAVAAALADGLLGDQNFYVVNGDNYWLDGPCNAFTRLARAFGPEMDGMLLVHRTCQVHSETGAGDFVLGQWGEVTRRQEGEIAPYIYAGIQLLSPRLFMTAPAGAFSMNRLWDQAIAAGRLRSVVHDGLWFHVTRPQDLQDAEHALMEQRTGETR